MKIIIQKKSQADDDPGVSLDDDNFNVPGFLQLTVAGQEVAVIHVKDLLPAAQAFWQRYKEEVE